MVTQNPEKISAVHILATINQLGLQAYLATTFESLIFQIVNDLQHAIFYNRALLWQWQEDHFKLLAISGQTEVNTKSALVENAIAVIQKIQKPLQAQLLSQASFLATAEQNWEQILQEATHPSIYWIPLFAEKKFVGALWLERWQEEEWPTYEMELLQFIAAVYGTVWAKFQPKFFWRNLGRYWTVLSVLSIALLFVVQVPLRVVAPCEIVPQDPIMITSPLEGIISHLAVKPGDAVKKDTVLFEYNKDVPLQHLRASEKQVEISESELHRAVSLAFNDSSLLSEIETLALKLHKEKIALDIAQQQAKKLEVLAPSDGIILLDDPEKWRGSPVNIGEKILQLCDPSNTKVRLWIPESDNVVLDASMPIKIFLNVHPNQSIAADISYIASYSHVSEKGIPSFLAEANWQDTAVSLKLGLKGSAILYGEKVSLLYWIVRRPWTVARNFFGF